MHSVQASFLAPCFQSREPHTGIPPDTETVLDMLEQLQQQVPSISANLGWA